MTYYEEPKHREPGPKATFEVKVESFDTSTFYEDIVAAAVKQVVGPRYPEAALVKQIHEAAAAMISQRIDAAIASTIESLMTKPIQKFDTFGNPVGEALSIEDIVRNGADLLLTQRVDREGRVTSNSYDTKMTRVEWLVQQAVIANLSKEMKAEADKVKAALLQRASAAAAAVLTGAVK